MSDLGAVDLVVDEVGRALPPGRALPDVLEIGCGTGDLAQRLRDAHPGAALLATDVSVRMVALTAARGIPARVMDAAAMDVPTGSYDVVVAAWMLHHLMDPGAGLAEVRRVLRPGGALVVATGSDERPLEGALREHFAEVRRTDVGGASVLVAR